MKAYLKRLFLTLSFALFIQSAWAQGITEQVGSSIGSGNVAGISRYFDNAVSMTVSGSQSTYSRSQAEMVLRDFFGKNAARSFQADRTGNSNGSSFAIGTLVTSNGTFRTFFTIRHTENGYVIQEIRIEK
ncbi:MAG: DUF4783 domain-containing protein [Bacteroidetes bacterium]|nr:DUF4783 domain-containing protein [Bacteroidota bacterium]